MSETNAPTLPIIVPKVIIRQKSIAQKAQPKKKKVVPKERTKAHPWDSRENLSDAYELPISQREAWWRIEVKVTPVPGTYESTDFLQELYKRPNTYNFKSEGRKKYRDYKSGIYLLPGGYEHKDFINIMSTKPATYRFKAGERFATDVLNFGLKDKYINIPPNAYNTQNYLAIDDEHCPLKDYMFRSQTKRFSSQMLKLDGPAPGSYHVKYITATTPAITSCFRSKIPRFKQSEIVMHAGDI